MTTRTLLTSPWTPIIINSNLDGAAVDIPDLATVGVTTPFYRWMICTWIFIISIQIDTGALLSIKHGAKDRLELRWSPTHITMVQGVATRTVAKSRIEGKWVMLTLEQNNAAESATTLWEKGISEFILSLTVSSDFQAPVYVKAPVGVGNFQVIFI